MQANVVGYRRFLRKSDGQEFVYAHFAFPFSNGQIKSGCCGCFTKELYVPDDYHNLFTPSFIGATVEIISHDYKDRTFIDDIIPLS